MIALVPGLGLSHRYFARLRPLLPEAQALDLNGSSLDELTASLGLAVRPGTLLVANSLGAQVATELAVRSPEKVRGLVLTGPTWDPAAPSVPGQLIRLLLDSYRELPSLVPVALLDYARRGPRQILAAAQAMLRHPMAERLAAVTAPVVVVRGSRDPIVGQAWAEQAAAAPADGRLVVVEGAAHAVDWSHPRAVLEVVQELEQSLGER
jgi:2-hydroxy-6-oxonona-2,4-dienedioate hydrolase